MRQERKEGVLAPEFYSTDLLLRDGRKLFLKELFWGHLPCGLCYDAPHGLVSDFKCSAAPGWSVVGHSCPA